ncbi:MAG: response regulator transcription factor [Paraclostridium sp.]
MGVIIISESFIVKDSLVDLFKDTFKTDDVRCVSSIDINSEMCLADIGFIFMDTSIENSTLLSYITKIKGLNGDTKIMILDHKSDKELFLNSVKMGVEGYILNILDKDEFVYILKKIINGKKFYDSELLQYNIENNVYSKGKLLTGRERSVLGYVAKGLSNRVIAENLGVTDYTIKKHVSSILTKLKLKNRQDIIIYARENHILDEIV